MSLFLDKINILLIFSAVLNLILGSVIFINGYKKRINFVYSLNILAIISWIVAMILYRSVSDEYGILFCTILYVVPTFIASGFLYFTYIFPSSSGRSLRFNKIIIYGINFIIALLVAVPGLIIKEVNIVPGQEKEIIFSGYYILYFLYTLSFFLFGFYRLFKKFFSSHGIEKLQIIYLAASYAVAANIAFATNLIMPWLGLFFFNWLGQLATSIMVVFTGYAIVKYRLMDIKLIATEIFAGIIVFISLFEVFNAKSDIELLIRSILLIVTLIFAILLVLSVLREVKRREQMEELTKQLKKTTKKLESANKELKRLDDAKSEFLSIASHQLRTPLTVIKGYSSMMLEGSFGKLNKVIKGNVEKIFISTERLISLVESLLNISRIEAGRLEFKIQPVDLVATTEAIVVDFQQRAVAKKIKLEFHKDGDIPMAAADAQKVKEVISNIIDNSIKYTPSGEIVVTMHVESQSVVFSCQDTGIGVEPEDLPRLFNKFVRGKGMMQVYTEGTGLGMYFARMVVENMGGRIWAESAGKGKGSKFSFSLPLADKTQVKKVAA